MIKKFDIEFLSLILKLNYGFRIKNKNLDNVFMKNREKMEKIAE